MARGGVTFTEVDEAARYLQGLGQHPTVDAIRQQLGTGSRTTLAEHLKRWKALQADGEGRLPQPLLTLVTGLWDSLQSLADQRIQENQSIAHQEVASLASQLQTAQQNEMKFKQERHQLQEALDTEQRAKSALVIQLQTLENSHDKLNTTYQSTLQQLEGAKQESQQLHKLVGQIQANLEHYQQAIHQQQLEQNLAKEKQHATYTQEILQFKSALDELNAKFNQNEKALIASQLQLQQAEENHATLTHRHEKLVTKYQETERAYILLEAREDLQQKQLQKLEAELLTAQQLSQSFGQQIAVYTNQLQRTKMELTQANDKIEALRHEKLFLTHEKGQSDGALKLLQNKELVT